MILSMCLIIQCVYYNVVVFHVMMDVCNFHIVLLRRMRMVVQYSDHLIYHPMTEYWNSIAKDIYAIFGIM